MVTFDKIVADIHAAHLAFGKTEISIEDVGDIVRATIKALGQYVHEPTGEVYDPAPKPVNVFPTQPRQSGIRYSGQPRRRRGGRR